MGYWARGNSLLQHDTLKKNYLSSSVISYGGMGDYPVRATRWGSWTEENTFFLLLHTQDGGSYLMPEKHDRTAESHAGVLGQKKNFFSSFTYTGWGEVILCLRNTIEQLNHTLGFLDRRRRILFLLLHTQDGRALHYA